MTAQTRPESADFSPAVRRLVAARCGGCCERCGRAGRLELHHRLYRSRGGTGDAFNALALCGYGNAGGCHGVAHTGAGEREGLSVQLGGDPLDVVVNLPRFGVVLFGIEGTVVRAESVPCWTHLKAGAEKSCFVCRSSGDVLWSVDEDHGYAFDRGFSREY